MKVVLERLADLNNETLWAHCEDTDCLHSARLDVLELMARFGEDTLLGRIEAMTKCTKCERKPCKLMLGSPDIHDGGGPY